MNIKRACEKAVADGVGMYRASWPMGASGVQILPTNGDCLCMLLPPVDQRDREIGKGWEPYLDDLIAEDWEVSKPLSR